MTRTKAVCAAMARLFASLANFDDGIVNVSLLDVRVELQRAFDEGRMNGMRFAFRIHPWEELEIEMKRQKRSLARKGGDDRSPVTSEGPVMNEIPDFF